MRRRQFITLIATTVGVAWPLFPHVQGANGTRRIAVMMLSPEGDPLGQRRLAALEQELERRGWFVGKNLMIDSRWGAFEPKYAAKAAAELLALKPDVILANSIAATQAAQKATRTVPIVFNAVSEPVRLGLVSSL
jgi:putative ABC transport system substrate-binding protein